MTGGSSSGIACRGSSAAGQIPLLAFYDLPQLAYAPDTTCHNPPFSVLSTYPTDGQIPLLAFYDPPELAYAPDTTCHNPPFSVSGVGLLVPATGRPYLFAVGVPPSTARSFSRLAGAVCPFLVGTCPFHPSAGRCWHGSFRGFL